MSSDNQTYYYEEWEQSDTDESCTDDLIRDELFYQVLIAPALIIALLFCFTKTRRRLYPHVLHGRPGLVYPMDLATKSKRIDYACAFGSTTSLIFKILFVDQKLFRISGPFMSGLTSILSAVGYGVVYLPVFACLTMDNAVGYGVGALYNWMLTIVSVISLWNCRPGLSAWFFQFMAALPYLICSGYLSCSNTIRFYRTLRRAEYFESKPETKGQDSCLESIQLSIPGKHVQRLLTKPKHVELENSLSRRVLKFIQDHTYSPDPQFQYSARFLATILTGTIIIYQGVCLLSDLAHSYQLVGFSLDIYICALVISTLSTMYNVLRHASCYRRDIFRMYRGELNDKMKDLSNVNLLVGAMKYSGHEIVHIFLSFLVNFGLIISALFMVYFVINLSIIWQIVRFLSPMLFWVAVNVVSQRLTARYAFLQNPKESLALNNRRVFFIFSYIIFFLNIVLGVFSFFLRALLNMAVSLFLMNRLDQSGFPPEYIHFDTGYQAYLGSLKLECSQTHPVMLVFIRLLQLCVRKQGVQTDMQNGGLPRRGDGNCMDKRRRAAIFHWHLLYTLINNPSIRLERRGYFQKLKRVRELGISIPKSDVIVDQYAICHLMAELEKDGKIPNSSLPTSNQARKEYADLLRKLLGRIQNRIRGGQSRLEEEIVDSEFDDPSLEENAHDVEQPMGTLRLQLQMQTDRMHGNDRTDHVV